MTEATTSSEKVDLEPSPDSKKVEEEPLRPRVYEMLDDLRRNNQDLNGKEVTKQISRTLNCTETRVRQLKKDYIRDRMNQDSSSPPSTPSPSKLEMPNFDHIDSAPDAVRTQEDLIKLAMEESAKKGYKTAPQCPSCHQPFKQLYPTCRDCGRKVIPDSEVLSAGDFKDLLVGVANTIFKKLGADELNEKEIDRGSKALGALAHKYRWTLFGYLPEIQVIGWGFMVFASRIPQIMEFIKKKKEEVKEAKEEAKNMEATENTVNPKNLPTLGPKQ